MDSVFIIEWKKEKAIELQEKIKEIRVNNPLLETKKVGKFAYVLSKGDMTGCKSELSPTDSAGLMYEIKRIKRNEFTYTTQAGGTTGMWDRAEYSYSAVWTLISKKAEEQYQTILAKVESENRGIEIKNKAILAFIDKKISELKNKYSSLTPTEEDLKTTKFWKYEDEKMKRKYKGAIESYSDLVERSKSEILTSTRVGEIEECEKIIRWVDPTFKGNWEQPKIKRTILKEVGKYEVFSEEGQDEIIEKIIKECLNMSIDDLNDDWKGENGKGEVSISFGDNYSFKLIMSGYITLGAMGMSRLGLKEVK